jgi:mono/diheme cytochrome c family protein
MKVKIIIGIIALTFVYGCSAKKTTAPEPLIIENTNNGVGKGVAKELAVSNVLSEGKSMYEVNCAKCHKLYDKNSFTPEEWTPIVMRMQKKARITDEQREKIYEYLTTSEM